MPDGMQKIDTILITKRKSYHRFLQKSIFFSIVGSLLLITFITNVAEANESLYTPAAPQGPSVGFLDVEYDYTIFTTSPNASWLFDWGDGTFSRWTHIANNESSITQSHQWTSAGVYQVRVKFKNEFFANGIWSDTLAVTINIGYSYDRPKTPIIASATIQGSIGQTYYYSCLGIDEQNDPVQYRFDWGNGTISDWTTPVPSGDRSAVPHVWNTSGNYSITAQSRDCYWLESTWSLPVNVTIVSDRENDNKTIEILLLDDVYHRIEYILGHEKIFHNTTSGIASFLQSNTGGTYLIDDTGAGTWTYVYNPSIGSIGRYQQPPVIPAKALEIPWFLIIIIGVITSIALAIFILIKTGFLYVYEEVVAEK